MMALIHAVVEDLRVDAVVDHPALVVRHLVKRLDLFLEQIADRDNPIDTVGAVALVIGDARGLSGIMPVAVAAILGRVHGQHGAMPSAFLDPDDGVGGEPVVRMDDVESADAVFHLEEVMHERAAHVVDFIDKAGIQRERAAVVVNPLDTFVGRLIVPLTREHVNVMSTAPQAGRQLGDVHADAADGDGVERFPRKRASRIGHPPNMHPTLPRPGEDEVKPSRKYRP